MKRLSEAEELIMSVIWNNKGEDLQLYTLAEGVSQSFGRIWKPQTVATYISRIIKKGYLRTYKEGRFTYYKPAISLDEYRKEKIQELQKFYFKDIKEIKKFIDKNFKS